MKNSTGLTLKRCEKLGFIADKAEHWNAFANKRKDLFGWIDILAFSVDEGGVIGIQSTTASNTSSHVAKVKAWPDLRKWLAAGNGAEVWCWKKGKSHGRIRWLLRRIRITSPTEHEDISKWL